MDSESPVYTLTVYLLSGQTFEVATTSYEIQASTADTPMRLDYTPHGSIEIGYLRFDAIAAVLVKHDDG